MSLSRTGEAWREGSRVELGREQEGRVETCLGPGCQITGKGQTVVSLGRGSAHSRTCHQMLPVCP